MVAGFRDRFDAGRQLADRLSGYGGRSDVVVLGLPRGGVPVAHEVARKLGAPLDIFVVRKLGLPRHEELAIGAIASGGVRVLNEDLVRMLNLPAELIERVARSEHDELARRESAYRGAQPFRDLNGRTVLLVDDGMATGASMRAAVEAVRRLGPARVVVAVPVSSPEALAELQSVADDVVSVVTPMQLEGVGEWYADFSQTTDQEVRALLSGSSK
jgi:putative phosphoribosyl transferase